MHPKPLPYHVSTFFLDFKPGQLTQRQAMTYSARLVASQFTEWKRKNLLTRRRDRNPTESAVREFSSIRTTYLDEYPTSTEIEDFRNDKLGGISYYQDSSPLFPTLSFSYLPTPSNQLKAKTYKKLKPQINRNDNLESSKIPHYNASLRIVLYPTLSLPKGLLSIMLCGCLGALCLSSRMLAS